MLRFDSVVVGLNSEIFSWQQNDWGICTPVPIRHWPKVAYILWYFGLSLSLKGSPAKRCGADL